MATAKTMRNQEEAAWRYLASIDGPITIERKVSIRVLANRYEHMQRAVDRAYLIETHGQVRKNVRLKGRECAATEFVAESPREGGIILDVIRDGA